MAEVAGGVITPDSENAEPADRKFVGSMMVYEAESIEAVRKIVESDIYWTSGVVSSSLPTWGLPGEDNPCGTAC